MCVDFKKAFDRVWHAALCATMNLYNVNGNIIKLIKNLYNKATSAVYLNNSIGDWLKITVGERQACLLSPTLFNVFLERIIEDALEGHEGTISIGGRTVINLWFADDIDRLAGKEEELVNLVECLDSTSTAYGMQISAGKTKLMTNNANGISTDIQISDVKLGCVDSFKYLGAIITDEGSKPEVLARSTQTTAAPAKLETIWNDKNIILSSKIRLMRSLVISIFLHACESWTLTAELTRSSGLTKTILLGTVPGERKRGRQKKRWVDNIKEWTGLRLSDTLRKAESREEWRELVAKTPVAPLRSMTKG